VLIAQIEDLAIEHSKVGKAPVRRQGLVT